MCCEQEFIKHDKNYSNVIICNSNAKKFNLADKISLYA